MHALFLIKKLKLLEAQGVRCIWSGGVLRPPPIAIHDPWSRLVPPNFEQIIFERVALKQHLKKIICSKLARRGTVIRGTGGVLGVEQPLSERQTKGVARKSVISPRAWPEHAEEKKKRLTFLMSPSRSEWPRQWIFWQAWATKKRVQPLPRRAQSGMACRSLYCVTNITTYVWPSYLMQWFTFDVSSTFSFCFFWHTISIKEKRKVFNHD